MTKYTMGLYVLIGEGSNCMRKTSFTHDDRSWQVIKDVDGGYRLLLDTEDPNDSNHGWNLRNLGNDGWESNLRKFHPRSPWVALSAADDGSWYLKLVDAIDRLGYIGPSEPKTYAPYKPQRFKRVPRA